MLGAGVITSCSDDEPSDPTANAYNAVMTYNGTYGDASSFTYYAANSDKPQMYASAKQTALSDADVNKRVALRFYMETAESGVTMMKILNLRVVPTAFLQLTDLGNTTPEMSAIRFVSLERTGPYLNLMAYLDPEASNEYSIVGDRTSAYSGSADLYLSIKEGTATSGTRQATLVSFDIKQVWENNATRSVKVHFIDQATGTERVQTFTK